MPCKHINKTRHPQILCRYQGNEQAHNNVPLKAEVLSAGLDVNLQTLGDDGLLDLPHSGFEGGDPSMT